MEVYKAINAVQTGLKTHGISKGRKNAQQGYQFRGIDDVYNALSPLLAENGLCILPRVLHRECVERMSAKGLPLFYVTVEAEFDFVSAKDGSKHTVKTFGEAMDSADKATNKAMSAAYKYAAFQAFAIPTEGDNDADATTPQPASNKTDPISYETITKENLSTLQTMLDALGLSSADYVAEINANYDIGFQISSLSHLPSGWLEYVTKALQKRISAKKKEAA